MTQLDVYTEEKFEDEEDMRERARDVMSDHRRSRTESDAVLDDLLHIAKEHDQLYPLMLTTLKRFGDIFEREMDS